jgi:hypothetical protein
LGSKTSTRPRGARELEGDVADVRSALEHGRPRRAVGAQQLDEVLLPSRLQQLPRVVELPDVVAAEPQPVHLHLEVRRREPRSDRVDEPSEAEAPQHPRPALASREV